MSHICLELTISLMKSTSPNCWWIIVCCSPVSHQHGILPFAFTYTLFHAQQYFLFSINILCPNTTRAARRRLLLPMNWICNQSLNFSSPRTSPTWPGWGGACVSETTRVNSLGALWFPDSSTSTKEP